MVKKKDVLLLAHLRQNSRVPLQKIAKKTRIPVSTLHDRVKARAGHCVLRNTCLIDFNKIGFNVKAHVLFRINKSDKEKACRFLANSVNVNNLYKINNGYDFIVEFIFRTISDLENFLEEFDAKFRIKSRDVHYIIEDLKREDFLSDPDFVPALFPESQ